MKSNIVILVLAALLVPLSWLNGQESVSLQSGADTQLEENGLKTRLTARFGGDAAGEYLLRLRQGETTETAYRQSLRFLNRYMEKFGNARDIADMDEVASYYRQNRDMSVSSRREADNELMRQCALMVQYRHSGGSDTGDRLRSRIMEKTRKEGENRGMNSALQNSGKRGSGPVTGQVQGGGNTGGNGRR